MFFEDSLSPWNFFNPCSCAVWNEMRGAACAELHKFRGMQPGAKTVCGVMTSLLVCAPSREEDYGNHKPGLTEEIPGSWEMGSPEVIEVLACLWSVLMANQVPQRGDSLSKDWIRRGEQNNELTNKNWREVSRLGACRLSRLVGSRLAGRGQVTSKQEVCALTYPNNQSSCWLLADWKITC